MQTFNEIAPEGINRVYFEKGTNADIIKAFFAEYDKAMVQGAKIAKFFQQKTFEASCLYVWTFVKYSIKYQTDPEGTQTIQLPSHLLNVSKSGDCKSKTLLCAAIISNFNFNGVKPTVTIRFTNYDKIDAYTHVYCLATLGKQTFIIDSVWKSFNSEKLYNNKKDFIMRINSVSGFNEAYTENIEGKKSKKKKEKREQKRKDRKEKRKEKKSSGGGLFNKGKKIALATPRASFLALVNVNARGLANKLYNSPADKVERIWKVLGGNPKKLYNAIAKGHAKKPFLGERVKVSVEGIGEPVTAATIAVLLTSAAGILAAFAPILKMVDRNKKAKDGDAATDEQSTEDILNEAKDSGGDVSVPDGELKDPEDGSGQGTKKSSGIFDFDIDLKSPKTLLIAAVIGLGLYKTLK